MVRVVTGSQRALAWSLLAACLLGASAFVPKAFADKGEKEFKAGFQAEVRRDWDEAVRRYQEALNLEPDNPQYMLAVGRARFQAGVTHLSKGQKLENQGNYKDALTEFEQAAALDPSSDAARQEIKRTLALLDQQKAGNQPGQPAPPPPPSPLDEAQGPPVLKPLSRTPINLHMTNESKVIFETIGKLAGVNVLFDPDFASKRITVDIQNESLENALNEVSLMTKNFWKVLTQSTILVLPDNAVKRREQEEQVIKTFYLSNPITPQELTEAVTAIRSLLETRRIQQINSLNAIIVRDTPDKVAIAEKIIRDIDKAKPEVVVDVAVLEVRRDKSRQLGLYPVSNGTAGIQVPATFNGTQQTTTNTNSNGTGSGTGTGAGAAATVGSIPLNQLSKLNTGDFSITLPGATLSAVLSDSNTKVLQRPEVRASDGQKATLRIGNRVPVATGSFQPGIGGVGVNPLVNTQFQYIDVGVNMDITPKVHEDGEISLKVRIEVSQVTNTTNIGGIDQPVIGQRIIDHDIRLREGEINILGGLMQTQTTKSVAGVPGLSQIPLLKYLFSNVNNTLAEDEVFIVLTPHTVRLPDFTPLNIRSIDIGTENDVHLRSARTSPEEATNPVASAPAPPASGARMRFQSPALVQKAGETFQVPVQIENVKDAASASLELLYDSGKMKLLNVASGGFLGRDGQAVAVTQRTDDQSGKTIVTLSRPPATSGVSGDGTLAVLTFQAAQAGTAPLALAPAIHTASQQMVPAEGAETTVTIR